MTTNESEPSVQAIPTASPAKSDTFLELVRDFSNKVQTRVSLFSLATSKGAPPKNNFLSNQYEVLLNQSIDLLDRALRNSNAFDDVAIKALEVYCEMYGQLKSLEELEERIAGGKHKLANAAGVLESDALKRYTTESSSKEHLDETMDFIATLADESREYLQGRLNGNDLPNKDPAARPGRNTAIGEMIRTRLEKRFKDDSKAAQDKRNELSACDYERQEAEAKYLRQIADVKAKATYPGGPFDFSTRLENLTKQIEADKSEIKARLVRVDRGLKRYLAFDRYDNVEPLPDLEKSTLADLRVWAIKTSSWLTRFSHRDVSFTHGFLLSSVIGDGWKDCIARLNSSGATNTSLRFAFPSGNLRDFRSIRVIGLSAYTIGNPGAPIRIDLTLPKLAEVVHSTEEGWRPRAITQILPPATMGAVVELGGNRQSETVGTVSLRNASPLGDSTKSDDPAAQWGADLMLASQRRRLDDSFDVWVEVGLNAQRSRSTAIPDLQA